MGAYLLADWETWAQGFLSSAPTEMTRQQGEVFLACCINEPDLSFPGPTAKMAPMYLLIEDRARGIDFVLTPAVTLFLSFLCDRPGMAVMYVYALKYRQHKGQAATPFTMNDLTHTFPSGFPSSSDLYTHWNAQKREGENTSFNLLDRVQFS